MIDITGLSKSYENQRHQYAVEKFTYRFEPGRTYGICGPSGCGKTTLLKMIGLLIGITDGNLTIDGINCSNSNEKARASLRASHVSMIFQEFALLEEDTALKNVLLPLKISGKVPKRERNAVVREALESVGMNEYANTRCNQLSGGEKQRVAIARAIVAGTPYILADEPTGALDSENSNKVMDVLVGLADKGKTIILVTHDPIVAERCDVVLHMRDGKLQN